MIRTTILIVGALWASSALSAAQSKSEAEKLANALKGDGAGAASANAQCKLFSKAEASGYIGESVVKVDNAAMGTGCQWTSSSDDGSMLVQVASARYHEKPSGAPGYKKLPDVGPQAFVVPQMGGWQAGALEGTHTVQVRLSGKGASQAKAVELLKESMKRVAAMPAK